MGNPGVSIRPWGYSSPPHYRCDYCGAEHGAPGVCGHCGARLRAVTAAGRLDKRAVTQDRSNIPRKILERTLLAALLLAALALLAGCQQDKPCDHTGLVDARHIERARAQGYELGRSDGILLGRLAERGDQAEARADAYRAALDAVRSRPVIRVPCPRWVKRRWPEHVGGAE